MTTPLDETYVSGTRVSATEPIGDQVANATLITGENEQVGPNVVFDKEFQRVLLLLGLEEYERRKKADAERKRQAIEAELTDELSTISVVREKITKGEFE